MSFKFTDPRTNVIVEVDTIEEYEQLVEKVSNSTPQPLVEFLNKIGVVTVENCERPELGSNGFGGHVKFKSMDSWVSIAQRMEFEEWLTKKGCKTFSTHRSSSVVSISSNIMKEIYDLSRSIYKD